MKFLLPMALIVLAVDLNTAWAQDFDWLQSLGWGQDFDNDFHLRLKKVCPQGDVLSDVYSIHHKVYQDRRSRLTCRPVPSGAAPGNCTWTRRYVNEWDGPVLFMCPANKVLAGIDSKFDTLVSDRRFKFQCCEYPGYKTSECQLTGYLNDWQDEMSYSASNDAVLTGWFSYHDNGFEDRRHKLVECLFSEKAI
ncbi:hypothetical protein RRG08_003869 [Elysia crispata]|uniref:Dermatopontin n=1 Tax=Elysia crispata TaxID=231223 RepID=A0AAE1DFK7_9GAST|nr:hypothetical protein RRG08_003869 [Elysia crispata]